MMKLKHLRHPIRSTRIARDLIAAHLEIRATARRGERRSKADNRYNLSAVVEGFAPHIEAPHEDTALLERICTAYRRAIEQQKSEPGIFEATEWWQEVRQRSLRPVMNALLAGDLAALRAMYRNFFRDPCSTGLISVPYGMTGAYFGKKINNANRHYYLSDVLHRVDYWKAQISGQSDLQGLAGPGIGNPFGAVIEDILVEEGAPYRHYCAQQVRRLLSSGEATVVEVGGGFGGMAYYLLRDAIGTRYIDFDVPETIALASYYLIRAFPDLQIVLYGEKELTKKAIAETDVVLLPLFEMARMPAQIAEVSFSSHSMCDVSQHALSECLRHIARMTRKHFLHIGVDRTGEPIGESIGESISESISNCHPCFRLSKTRLSGWHSLRNSRAAEIELLYKIEPIEDEPERCSRA